ncbi:hypothetical protein MPLB_790065 [Mesorhizobium sp. ORS 3324]|nr:hypothetical protein MPLB_790065 [Mesorhizobium sp. ORS 3324]
MPDVVLRKTARGVYTAPAKKSIVKKSTPAIQCVPSGFRHCNLCVQITISLITFEDWGESANVSRQPVFPAESFFGVARSVFKPREVLRLNHTLKCSRRTQCKITTHHLLKI